MRTPDGQHVSIQEVSPRDGFQIEPRFIPTEQKIAFINQLSRTGIGKIEVTSFTSPRAIPALADAEAVMRTIDREPGVMHAALVPNVRGCERALVCGVDEINLVMSASETHNLANLRMTCDESLRQFAEVASLISDRGARVNINGSLSTTFGCPFEGDVPLSRVLALIERMLDAGVHSLSLCDTTGMANPRQVESLFRDVKGRWPQLTLTAHFHNTRGMGLANVVASLEAGVNRFDSSLGGLGGCPYAPGATGNVCTEDLVHMLATMGYDTGVDLDQLIRVARDLPALVEHDVPGQVMKAGPSSRRYAPPDLVRR